MLAAVIGLEIGLRVVQPAVAYQYAPQRMVLNHFAPSDYLPFELKRNFRGQFRMLEFDSTVSTNSLGLRDNEIDFSRPRILCLGDSFTFGFGVENDETFCARLEARFGGRYDVVNAGFAGGSSPDAYALWLSRRFDEVRPALIICSLFQNDLTDVRGHRWEPDGEAMPQRITMPGVVVTRDGALLRDNFVTQMPPQLRMLIKNSYVVAILRDRLLKDAEAQAVVGAVAATPAPTGPGATEPTDRRLMRALEFLQTAARTTPIVLHLIPFKGQMDDSYMDTTAKAFAAGAGWATAQDYRAFDDSDYFTHDGHWLQSGHEKAATYLHAALVRLGL
jgi:lysophospholipase L1-like esterase